MKMEIRAFKSFSRGRGKIQLWIGASDGKTIYDSEPVVITQVKPEDIYTRDTVPSLELDAAEAQILMDNLWDCGLRPSEGTGSAGALSAVQKHLDDMRKIVFNKLKIGDPL